MSTLIHSNTNINYPIKYFFSLKFYRMLLRTQPFWVVTSIIHFNIMYHLLYTSPLEIETWSISLSSLSLSLSLSCSPIKDLHETPLPHLNSSSHSLASPSRNKQLSVIIFCYITMVSRMRGVTCSTFYCRTLMKHFCAVVKTHKRRSNKIYKTELTKIKI